MNHVQRLDRAYLRRLIDASFDRAEFARMIGVGEGRLSMLLLGEGEFRYSEMMRAAKLLGLDAMSFERCFFGK